MSERRVPRPSIRVAGLAGALSGALCGAAPGTAQPPTECVLSEVNAGPGVHRCEYEGQPPTASVVASVPSGRVAFVWICDSRVEEFIGNSITISRSRATVESCLLLAEVLRGPATFTATAA